MHRSPLLAVLLLSSSAPALAQEVPAESSATAASAANEAAPASTAAPSGAAGQAAASAAQPNVPGMSLQDAVNQALGNSAAIRQAEADYRAQRESKRGAWADLGPRARLEYNEVHNEQEKAIPLNGQNIVLQPKTAKVGSLTVGQPITSAIALFENARLEGVQEDLKEISLTVAKTNVAFQAADTWLKAHLAERQLEIAAQSIAAAENQLKDAQALERVGRMNRGDVLKLQLSLSEAQARAAQARAGREIGFAALREQLGLPLAAPLAVSDSLADVPEVALQAENAVQTALGSRAEVKLADGGVTAAAFGKKLAYTQFTPTANVFVKWDRNLGDSTGPGSKDTTRSYGLQFAWDIWNNGSSVFAVREAAANVIKAEEGRAQVDNAVRLDVVSALANLRAARESLALAKVAVSQAEEAYRIEKIRFQTGARSATDLVLAESSQANAKGRLVAAQTDLIGWHLKLQKALGQERPQI